MVPLRITFDLKLRNPYVSQFLSCSVLDFIGVVVAAASISESFNDSIPSFASSSPSSSRSVSCFVIAPRECEKSFRFS